MKRLLVLGALGVLGCAVSSLGLGDDPPPPPHQAIYAGCGTVFGTCARVAILADSQPSGWDITVEVTNLGRGATPAASLIVQLVLNDVSHPSGVATITSGTTDVSDKFFVFTSYDNDERPVTAIDGYREESIGLPDSSIVVGSSQTAGVYDARCAATPACDALRRLDNPASGSTSDDWIAAQTFFYLPGPVVFHFHAASYTRGLGVEVSQWFTGSSPDYEAYPLAPAD